MEMTGKQSATESEMKALLNNLKRRISDLAGDRRGQTMIEYALLAGLLAVGGALLLIPSGENVGATYTNVAQVLQTGEEAGDAPAAGSPPSSPSDDGGDSGNGGGNGDGNDKGNGDNNGNGGGNGKGNGNGGKK
jgi:Flp pilus assembly pilin Flp